MTTYINNQTSSFKLKVILYGYDIPDLQTGGYQIGTTCMCAVKVAPQ